MARFALGVLMEATFFNHLEVMKSRLNKLDVLQGSFSLNVVS